MSIRTKSSFSHCVAQRTLEAALLVALFVLGVPAVHAQQSALVESGRTLQVAGEHETAMLVLGQALSRDEARAAEVHSMLATSAEALGRREEAQRHLRAALASTDDPWVIEHLAELSARLAAVADEPRPTAAGGNMVASGAPPPPPPPPPPPAGTLPSNTSDAPAPATSEEAGTLFERYAPPEEGIAYSELSPWRRRTRLQLYVGGGASLLNRDDFVGAVEFGTSVVVGLVPALSVHGLLGASMQIGHPDDEINGQHRGVSYRLRGDRQRTIFMLGGTLRAGLGRSPAFVGLGATVNAERDIYEDAWVSYHIPAYDRRSGRSFDGNKTRWSTRAQLLAEFGLNLGRARRFELRSYFRYHAAAMDFGLALGIPLWVSQ